jgi:glutamate N-acetyltransferase/amino-acid N-acetyltransferase
MVPGFRAGGVASGIKKDGAKDLALVFCPGGASAAGVFTANQVQAAPVLLARAAVRRGKAAAILANSGCANAYTGRAGAADAREVIRRAASVLGLRPDEILPASTGVIGERLPVSRIRRALPALAQKLSATGWRAAADAIRTTDTRPKLAWRRGRGEGRALRVAGIAKGAGMIEPHMATLLVFLATNARVGAPLLRRLLKGACDRTFNRLTIDGCTSTNDTALILASGEDCPAPLKAGERATRRFAAMLEEVCADLADQILADGEGATKRVRIRVRGARSDREAARAAYAVGNSLLVKTALTSADPNWGRIVQALGSSPARIDPGKLGIRIGGAPIVRRGAYGGAATEAAARGAMRSAAYEIWIDLGIGRGEAEIGTCDLSEAYVRINASYRS